ncbi:YkgJ family cysteine cluster protein [Pseudoxanthomonas sp. 10H]|uniref:YkgJ family cysteine cluster protein n=1 Tax=Pseudoxanthomonas sp. 10H TaxID=3242729 RepID=UPI00355913E2
MDGVMALAAPAIRCDRCAALCCRLTAVLQPGDEVPLELTAGLADGSRAMAQDADGWCLALDHARMGCGIYERRPQACRRFAMDGPHCRALRIDRRRDRARRIPARVE